MLNKYIFIFQSNMVDLIVQLNLYRKTRIILKIVQQLYLFTKF